MKISLPPLTPCPPLPLIPRGVPESPPHPLSPQSGRHWFYSILLWVALAVPAQAAVTMRVSIERDVSQVKVGSSTKAVVREYGTNRLLGEIPAMAALYAQRTNTGGIALAQMQSSVVWIEPTDAGYVYIGDHWYRGKVLVVPTAKGLTATNIVDLEQYLYSVVGSEVYNTWPQEALKAQAVAARTYALHERQSARNGIYDLGNTPQWQAYRGIETEASTTQAAVNATAGLVVTYQGDLIDAQFHNCSGGHTENVEDVWGNYLPYLRGVQSDDSRDISECQWEKNLSREEIGKRISGVGNVVNMLPERTPYNSVKTMKVVGDRGTRTLTGEGIKEALGLKSQHFTVTPQYDLTISKENVKPIPTAFKFLGLGWGHGVGLSQWGAHHMALKGYNYQQILTYYYQKTTLAKIQVQ